MLPMTAVYSGGPKGWANPVNLRASAALAAAGAWDAAPTASFSSGARRLTLSFTYTRGGAAGAFDWQIEISPYSVAALAPAGAAEWITGDAIYAAGAVAAGADTTSFVQRELQTYTATGAGAEDFAVGPIEFDGTIERIRVRARESGNVALPSTLQITGVLQ
jgi:hypothetical protein